MCPEELKSQIQLIFAQACADALKSNANVLLQLKDGEAEQVAKAHGEAFAFAFVFLSHHFTSGLPYSDQATPFEAASLDGLSVRREKTSTERTLTEAMEAAKRYL